MDITTLTEQLQVFKLPFAQYGMLGAILAGFICGLIGPFFVWRRLAMFGNAISHAALAPIAVAQVIQIPFIYFLYPFSILLALWLTRLEEKGLNDSDSVLSVFFSGLMAVGVVIISMSGTGSVEAIHFLFGDILLISSRDLILLGFIAIILLFYVVKYLSSLILLVLNPDLAKVQGIAVRSHNYILTTLCALVVSSTLIITGAILTTMLMIVPPLIASGFTKTFRTYIVVSCFLGMVLASMGLLISVLTDTPSGPMIAGTCLFAFIFSTLLRKSKI